MWKWINISNYTSICVLVRNKYIAYYAKYLLKRFHLNGSTIGSGLPILKLQWQCRVGMKD